MIRNLKYFLLTLLASVLFNSCFVVEKQTVETSAKESYASTQPSVSKVRSTSASTETDLTDYSYLDGSWYEDTLHEKSNLRDYFYRIKGNQISVVDKKHNKKETFFGFKISNGKVTISSKGEDSKKIAPGTYPISIKSENQFTISFAKPMSFIRNTYAHDQAEAFVEKATDISLGAGAISGLSGALDMGVQIGIDAKNAEYAKVAVEKSTENILEKEIEKNALQGSEKVLGVGAGAYGAARVVGANKQDYVYRVIRDDENPTQGLFAKNPDRGMTIEGHVSSGSRNNGSQYISTTTDYNIAKENSVRDNCRIVKIDLNKLSDNVNIYDLSTDDGRNNYLKGVTAKNFAKASSEVLLEGYIPADALTLVD